MMHGHINVKLQLPFFWNVAPHHWVIGA